MDRGMYELVEMILRNTSFIAVGGAIALIFFFVFAPSILGSKTLHRQVKDLQKETEQINDQLRKISRQLEDAIKNSKERD
jgi:hypothetical protein